ncbi:MAG: ABC transporter substrate-binding protein [Chloroflexi bacterium]|nr:ABC transporter substrate-binding protein [Chloroflexota bacterium]
MFSKIGVLFLMMGLGSLFFLTACRAAAPTATLVPPTPTTAPAPTAAPAPTIAPAPAATVAPVGTALPITKFELPKEVKAIFAKYPQIQWYDAVIPPSTTPKYGGTFLRGSSGPLSHWDPRITNKPALEGSSVCYGGLLRNIVDKFGGRVTPVPLPDAAESWKRLDETTVEFKLNPNVFWHDRPPVNGRRVTAEDLKWNIEQYRGKSIYAGSFQIISDIIIKDPTTLVVKTSEPFAHLFTLLAGSGMQFIAPEVEKEPGGAKNWCIGYGPFKLTQYEPSGNWEAERHPKYHVKGHTGLQLPYLDKVSRIKVADFTTEYASFVTGKTHIMVLTGGGEVDRTMKDCPTCQGMLHVQTGFDSHIGMRLDKPPFNDVRIRRALSMGFNRGEILADIFKGIGYISLYPALDSIGWDNAPALEQRGKYLQFNLPEAKRLLAEAGYANGFKTTMNIQSGGTGVPQALLEVMQFQWKQNLGVDVAFVPLDAIAHAAVTVERRYEGMDNVGSISPSTNWDSASYGFMYSKSGSNVTFINDPEVDKWAVASRTTFDPVKQREAYKKLFELEEENVYRIMTISPYRIHMVQGKVENATPGLYSWIYSWAARSMEGVWFKE